MFQVAKIHMRDHYFKIYLFCLRSDDHATSWGVSIGSSAAAFEIASNSCGFSLAF
jgi:hypothetical protein